ncbi:Mitochondrial inner membrane protein oxa1 [Dissophora globulifera]|uniref:Mitochondrial inner membrane protein oxa1 n=1 Tax=Dissophora globulifera TaxID=979702 RepID=A0A9P6UZ21_9FUNG|nr:Mitochondrial inner membrane protein oxa1 [Dissophora globulifera]
MSDYTQNLHDPATETHLEDSLEDNDGTSSGILLEKGDYEHSSPEVSSLNSSMILEHPEDKTTSAVPITRAFSGTAPVVPIQPVVPVASKKELSSSAATTDIAGTTSTAVVDLNQTMPWKLIYPIMSRETIISLCKATAINLLLPFINGVFLGFGEICAHELTYRWGWTNSAHVVSVPGRRPANVGDVGVRAAGVSGAGSPASVSGSAGSGYAGSRSGIGGLGRYEDDFASSSNRSSVRQY